MGVQPTVLGNKEMTESAPLSRVGLLIHIHPLHRMVEMTFTWHRQREVVPLLDPELRVRIGPGCSRTRDLSIVWQNDTYRIIHFRALPQ